VDFSETKLHELIFNLSDEFSYALGLVPFIGCEIEFYLTDMEKNRIECSQAHKFKESMLNYDIEIEEEKGKGQFEIQISCCSNLINLTKKLKEAKKIIVEEAEKLNFLVTFQPKPFKDDYGSSLHVHLSLNDKQHYNIFSRYSINHNKNLLKSIYGILDLLPEGIFFFCNHNDFYRLKPLYMAPTNISWGGNNRTTAIRIPDDKPESRRIEFRVASADASLERIISFMLIGAYHGLNNDALYYPRIYGNAFDEQYSLQLLPEDLNVAENIFHKRAVLKNYLYKFQQELYGR
jgi:glutamine synthetase